MSREFLEFGQSAGFVRELFELYVTDKTLVSEVWARYFDAVGGIAAETAIRGAVTNRAGSEVSPASLALQESISRLITAYRTHGHLAAAINPLTEGIVPLPRPADLEPSFHRISSADMRESVRCDRLRGREIMNVEEIVNSLHEIYTRSVGIEYAHITDATEREWVRREVEELRTSKKPHAETRKAWLRSLIDAEALESEIHKKYVGAKRFSVEGGEALMPLIETILDTAASENVSEAIFGMAHRGRLNVLCNTIGKPLVELFREFEDKAPYSVVGAGDVKYHNGYLATRSTIGGHEITVQLAPNPSHLEFVNPVVEGMARAYQDRVYNRDRKSVMPILIHGDAAFIGQGVVTETINMARVAGYTTGGTVHIVVNNQIGFTTTSDESRSTLYSTDWLKAIEAPVFHVNGEDIDSVCWVADVATRFRNEFGKDVGIDIVCYRKYGHNEGDDPSFTQPHMYKALKDRKNVAVLYGEKLTAEGIVTLEERESFLAAFRARFDAARDIAANTVHGEACPAHGKIRAADPVTRASKEVLASATKTLTSFPEGFKPHAKVAALLEKRVQAFEQGKGIEWGFAETLAYGALKAEGIHVRLSGQDCGRGTFSHRHLAVDNTVREELFYPLDLAPGTGSFEVHNSTLSETGALGFEFGYAAVQPQCLVMWEGQFGDFANGAQVIIDQFISSSESKWGQTSGVMMLLPHGYEGQGPEHSSARLERFLQLCAEGNISVVYPTTAAQCFHMIRRQGLLGLKRPVVVMTPKSLLRMPEAAADLSDLTDGAFKPVIVTDWKVKAEPKHVVLLTGKVYYDVAGMANAQDLSGVRVIRVEELYPFPEAAIREAVGSVKEVMWVQEEPQNMGSWNFVEPRLRALGLTVRYIGRPESAATACGSGKFHAKEQKNILDEIQGVVKSVEFKRKAV